MKEDHVKIASLISDDLLNLINKVQEHNPNDSEPLIEARAKVHEFIYSDNSKVKKLEWTPDRYALFNCPRCETQAWLDKDQYEGKVSINCGNCEFHETIDFRDN